MTTKNPLEKQKTTRPITRALAAVLVISFLCVLAVFSSGCQKYYTQEELAEARQETLTYKDRVGIVYIEGHRIVYIDSSGRAYAVYPDAEKRECFVEEGATALSAVAGTAVVLCDNGQVVSYSNNMHGQGDTGEWENIVSVKTSGWHTVGLISDGTVVATGFNKYGQCDVSDWSDIKKIFLTDQSTYGLKEDGTVVATGCNSSGECEVSDWEDIVDLSGGAGFVLGLKEDGTVVSAGINYEGQCDVSDWTDIIALSASSKHTVGLRSDGIVVATGLNRNGECNTGDWFGIIDVMAYDRSLGGITVGFRNDGMMIMVGTDLDEDATYKVTTDENIIAIYSGSEVDCFLTEEGFIRSEIFEKPMEDPLW